MAFRTRCLKYLLLAFTVAYAISGLALVVLEGLNIAQIFDYRSLLPPPVLQCTWVVAGMGAATILVAVVGWCGAAKENRRLLRGFAVVVVLVIVVQLSCAVWALVVRVSLQERLPDNVVKAFKVHDPNNTTSVALWSSLQRKMQCCAADGPGDYRGSAHVPWSCCASDSPHEGSCHRLYQRGCVQPLVDFVALRLAETAGLAAVASLLQVGGAFLAVCFANTTVNEKRRSNV